MFAVKIYNKVYQARPYSTKPLPEIPGGFTKRGVVHISDFPMLFARDLGTIFTNARGEVLLEVYSDQSLAPYYSYLEDFNVDKILGVGT